MYNLFVELKLMVSLFVVQIVHVPITTFSAYHMKTLQQSSIKAFENWEENCLINSIKNTHHQQNKSFGKSTISTVWETINTH
jgi:hypothetical protein